MKSIEEQIDFLCNLDNNNNLEEQSIILNILESLKNYQVLISGAGNDEYKQFVAVYIDFYQSLTGAIPKITGAQGNALKRLMKHFRINTENKTHEEALANWKGILASWDKLSPFIRQQVSISNIEKHINEIVTQLHKGHHDKQAKRDAEREKLQQLKDGAAEVIRHHTGGGGTET